tara:strand:+ start:1077 stop:1214 length:138 start_codon:yes stop_codon:yes gene_type:complete
MDNKNVSYWFEIHFFYLAQSLRILVLRREKERERGKRRRLRREEI